MLVTAEHALHITLKKLIMAKSQRDNINFTAYKLAQTLAIPRSIITKLTHVDVNKRVKNPKLETIIKIVDFFQKDGFDITLEELLNNTLDDYALKILSTKPTKIAIYSMNKYINIGTADIKLIDNNSNNVIGLYTESDLEPFFKIGSVFIINTAIALEDQHLVAIRILDADLVQIRRYCRQNDQDFLQSIAVTNHERIKLPQENIEVLGVIIQINANT